MLFITVRFEVSLYNPPPIIWESPRFLKVEFQNENTEWSITIPWKESWNIESFTYAFVHYLHLIAVLLKSLNLESLILKLSIVEISIELFENVKILEKFVENNEELHPNMYTEFVSLDMLTFKNLDYSDVKVDLVHLTTWVVTSFISL